MSPAAAELAVRIERAVAAWELNEIAEAGARLDERDRAELQRLFAARCAVLWPDLVRRYR